MVLQLEDLMLLNKAESGQRLEMHDPVVLERLQSKGLIGEEYCLTEKGEHLQSRLREVVEEQQRGVPFERRWKKNAVHEAAMPRSTQIGWFTGSYAKKSYLTNGALFLLGRPDKSMDAVKGDSEIRHKVAVILQSCTAGKPEEFVEVKPYAFQVLGLGKMEIVWLRSEDGSIVGSVQAMFYDLVKYRYPTARFSAHRERFLNGNFAHQVFAVQVVNRGLKNNIVALVMALAGGSRPEI